MTKHRRALIAKHLTGLHNIPEVIHYANNRYRALFKGVFGELEHGSALKQGTEKWSEATATLSRIIAWRKEHPIDNKERQILRQYLEEAKDALREYECSDEAFFRDLLAILHPHAHK